MEVAVAWRDAEQTLVRDEKQVLDLYEYEEGRERA